jgi:hypothetical protein
MVAGQALTLPPSPQDPLEGARATVAIMLLLEAIDGER